MMDEYRNFCSLFDAAERRIKQFEKLEIEPCLPAINQLRYAACHLKRSFSEANHEQRMEAIKSAERHCCRAIYDCTEATIDFVAVWLREYERGYRFVSLNDEIPDHFQMRAKVIEAQDFAAAHNHDDAENVTAELESYMEHVLQIHRQYESARAGLNKRARITAWKAIAAIAGILVALAGIIIPLVCTLCD